MTTDLVLVDTCIWVPYFNRPQSAEKRNVDSLLDDDRVVLVGPIVAEALRGFRSDAQADWVASVLRGTHYCEADFAAWCRAAKLGRSLAAKGKEIPLSDSLIAAVAFQRHWEVYSIDPDFDHIPELKRYQPKQ